jgi:hypothetical protein
MKMSETYTRDFSPEVNAKINAAQSTEEIRSIIMAEMERLGLAERRDRDQTYTPTQAQAASSASSAPQQNDAPTSNLMRRVITVKGSDWLISGRTEDELYRMEMAMKSAL